MNMKEVEFLYACLDNPDSLSAETLNQLKAMKEAYPWCAPLRMLYMKNLKNLNHSCDSELAESALYVPERRVLCALLDSEKLIFEKKKEEEEKKEAVQPASDSFTLIDDFLTNGNDETGSFSLDSLFESASTADYLYWSEIQTVQTNLSAIDDACNADVPRLKGQDLIDSFLENEGHSMSKILKLQNEQEVFVSDSNEYTLDLGDCFPNDSDDSVAEAMVLMYIKQARYEQALQIIRNLRLKNPKKNVYFADQIRFLEKLIINTKKIY